MAGRRRRKIATSTSCNHFKVISHKLKVNSHTGYFGLLSIMLVSIIFIAPFGIPQRGNDLSAAHDDTSTSLALFYSAKSVLTKHDYSINTAIRTSKVRPLQRILDDQKSHLLSANSRNQKIISKSALCPWTTNYQLTHFSPAKLAAEVVAKMNLLDMLVMVNLYHPRHSYENATAPIPSLCIPAFTLQDGPNGLSAGDTGVTQLPASLALGATFSTNFAQKYGQIIGQEARMQQVDAVQGPNLNLVRVPEWGRAYETYGEDPFLSAALGVADSEGIQSEHTMSVAKHFTAYTDETGRIALDQEVSSRALMEVYLKPFKAVVQQADVAAIMCAYGYINNVNACSDKYTFTLLREFGFKGIIRSDLDAVKQPLKAFNAGLDQIKPSAGLPLALGWISGRLQKDRLVSAVKTILTEMFIYHLIPGQNPHKFGVNTINRQATNFAYNLAANSTVLLKNANNLLPINIKKIDQLYKRKGHRGRPKRALKTIAVIGTDAASQAMTAGYGGARVTAPFLVTPLESLRRYFQKRHIKVTYSPAGPSATQLPVISSKLLAGESVPEKYWPTHPHSNNDDIFPDRYLRYDKVPPYALTASLPAPPGKGNDWNVWSAELTPTKTGLYDFSISSIGDTWIYLDKANVFSQKGLGAPFTGYFASYLTKGKQYRLVMRWFATNSRPAPRIGMEDITPQIDAAVAAAKAAKVAVVFVNSFSSEGVDRSGLSLQDADNQLISAVAKVNPRTIVVLNTGGAVLMPWLKNVSAVLEAWYPGEEDGNAIRAVLSGEVNPSGHLPITFPASDSQPFGNNTKAWPGINAKVSFSINDGNGLEIGYRYYEAHHLQPLFPFGYGLSYTTFSISNLSVKNNLGQIVNLDLNNIPLAFKGNADAYSVNVEVTNTGKAYGCDVPQIYLQFPHNAGEPPKELAGFTRTCLSSGAKRTVTIEVPLYNLEVYKSNHLSVPTGQFRIYAGFSSENTPLVKNIYITR